MLFPLHTLRLVVENSITRQDRRGELHLNDTATIAKPQSAPSARMANIKALALAATALACVPSAGWGNPIQLNSPGAAQVYGDGSAASAATARSAATAGAAATASPTITTSPTITASPTATATGGVATGGTATINITRGGGGGHGNGASRGAGAGTPSAASQSPVAGQPTAAAQASATAVGPAVPLATGNTLNAPPGFGLPAFGGGQCATVGFGIAASPSGGGAFGPAWESTNCRNYYIAVTLIQAGHVDQGMRLLSMITPEAKQVMASSSAPAATPAADEHAIDLCTARPGWSSAELSARYPECKK